MAHSGEVVERLPGKAMHTGLILSNTYVKSIVTSQRILPCAMKTLKLFHWTDRCICLEPWFLPPGSSAQRTERGTECTSGEQTL